MIWTAQFCPFEEVQSSSTDLEEKRGQLNRSSSFIRNVEFAILNMLKSVVSQAIKYFITSSNIIIWVGNFVLGFSGSTCWVPFAIITRVPFVLVFQLMFLVFFFFLRCVNRNFGKKFYMSTSWRNFSKSVIFIFVSVFIFQIQ